MSLMEGFDEHLKLQSVGKYMLFMIHIYPFLIHLLSYIVHGGTTWCIAQENVWFADNTARHRLTDVSGLWCGGLKNALTCWS